MFGSLNESGSTVGMNELLRVFPERRAQFYFLTWNLMGLSMSVRAAPTAFIIHSSPFTVHHICRRLFRWSMPHRFALRVQKLPANLFDDLLFPSELDERDATTADVYVLAFQEASGDKRELLARAQAALGAFYVLFDYCELGSLLLGVFFKRELIWYSSGTMTLLLQSLFSVCILTSLEYSRRSVRNNSLPCLHYNYSGRQGSRHDAHDAHHKRRCGHRVQLFRHFIPYYRRSSLRQALILFCFSLSVSKFN